MRTIIYLLSLLFISCGTTSTDKILVSNYGQTQGTTYSIRYMSSNGVNYKTQIDSLLLLIDSSLSTYNEHSIISKINRNESKQTDSLFRKVFDTSLKIAKVTNGAFDPTIAPVVNYWGFGFEDIPEKNKDILPQLMESVGHEKVFLENDLLKKTNPNVQLDFNAIAQGFSVDFIAAKLEEIGISDYMIEIGGELKCKGVNADEKLWRIGIDKPSEVIEEDRFQAIIEVKDKAVASSGNYRKFKVDNQMGTKYAHTINPRTGEPVLTNLLSATVISNSCMTADAYATAFMVMGTEKSIDYLKKYTEIDALLIYSGPKGEWLHFQTEGFEQMSIYQN